MKKNLLFILLLMLAMTTIQAQNPFFSAYKTPYDTPPFDKIKNEHYEPAIEKGIAEHQAEINKIVMVRSVPIFENTIVPLEESGKLLSRVTSVFFNLLSAESNDEMLEIAQRIQPKLSEHSNAITLNEGLFRKIKTVYDKRFESNLTPEQIRLVEKTYQGFENSGATLTGKDRDTYKELSSKLSQLTLTFGQNALKEGNKFEMILTDDADLAGLPQMVKDAAAAKAKSKGKDGYMFDLSAPSYIAFMKYSTRRDLRQKLYMAYTTKCVAGGEFDNQENVKEIAKTRMQIANLLGYPDYATYVLRNKMAKDKEHVYGLLNDLFDAYAHAAREDVKMVEGFAVGMEGKAIDLQPWDWSFYSEKLKDAKYSVSDELVRPYFELENVKKGVFGLATDLYGITFKKNTQIPVYHPEVEAFDVLDEKGNFLSVLYTDFHPREGKRQGAWMTEFKGQYIEKGKDSRPFVSIVMNFTRPTATEPALLTFDEVETFLHEFGHALHGMLTKCTYETLSGTNVLHDFVELPSQIMENWLTEKEYLDKFAVHYKTGEKIPADLVKKLVDAANYNAGYLCYRQLSFGFLDMAWHTLQEPYTGDVIAFERKAMDKTALLPVVDGTNMSTSFSHIFSGGYAAGYYGYKWAEVLDADAFALFKQTGIFNKETARSFRQNILEKGNTEEPMSLYIKFRGQEPTVNALLERNGVKK
ncbi:M3 family peptidase [Dysgonomonas sp. 521]|uniref:M3 family metallopeptidase n=1 Tax=Dysgonomonas sp. 521 TaxID=2302932 RepID=UPI0013D8AD85|nr:M3 family metallopeptidase [Dysgonomonas sp. 521]NDV93880.1 M3 family peptidase [Dysgonomonas sp. 521]